MTTKMTPGQQLRAQLKKGMLVAPGAYDGLTAKLVESAGFSAVYMTGAGVSASFGLPDYGLVTMEEMAATAQNMADSVSIPLIVDSDTGYGNELNAIRTVRTFERRGIAGMHIEDQVFPKKCGHLDNKEVISIEQFTRKIRAVVEQRLDPDFVIIARTDARTVLGFDEAVKRCNAALEAGADIAFLESPLSREEIIQAPKRVKGPCLLNLVHGGKTPLVTLKEAADFGYAITIVPALVFMTVMASARDALQRLKATGEYPVPTRTMTVVEAFGLVGASEWDAQRTRYAETPAPAMEKAS
jgi:2-methylisocitrate lyase-like PEP mutase family enzyme